MRIGIEARRLFRPHKHGMDVYALELIRHLQQIDEENQYFVFVRPDEDAACFPDALNFFAVEVEAMSYPDWEQVHLPRLAERHQLDVLHCTANTAPLRYRGRTVVTIHDVLYLEQNHALRPGSGTPYQRFGSLYRRMVVPLIAKQADKLLTVSDFQRGRIARALELDDGDLQVTHNGVGEAFFRPPSAEQRRQVRATYDLPPRYYLFLENRERRKNLNGVLRAYAHLLDTRDELPKLVIKGVDRAYLGEQLDKLGAAHLAEHCRLIEY
ncbi:MAG: glycosyltransferase, partial [Catalinimonas sp.]